MNLDDVANAISAKHRFSVIPHKLLPLYPTSFQHAVINHKEVLISRGNCEALQVLFIWRKNATISDFEMNKCASTKTMETLFVSGIAKPHTEQSKSQATNS